MKKIFTNAKNRIYFALMKLQTRAIFLSRNTRAVFANQRGDTNVGQAIAILITIVIGALLLAGLYVLFEDVVLPTVTARVTEMFNYRG